MNFGVAIVAITALGCVSNWLNWRYLNYKITRLLYYLGAFIHETSHAVFCVLTGAKIVEYKVLSLQPRVVHTRSKLPFLGEPLISLAPIMGGLFFLYAVNRYFLAGYFSVPQFSGWQDIVAGIIRLFAQINLLQWQSWVMILLFFNLGAMIGSSPRDLRNIWPFIILSFFARLATANFALLVIALILTNIAIQTVLIIFLEILGSLR